MKETYAHYMHINGRTLMKRQDWDKFYEVEIKTYPDKSMQVVKKTAKLPFIFKNLSKI